MSSVKVVIDANVLDEVVKEIQSTSSGALGIYESLFLHILGTLGIALNRIICQEWYNTCGIQWVDSWLPEAIATGQAREYSGKTFPDVRNALRKQGMQPKDIRYIMCAIESGADYIFSMDIDFYEPRARRQSHSSKSFRRDRNGQFWRYVHENYAITAGCFCHVIADLNLSFTPIETYPNCH